MNPARMAVKGLFSTATTEIADERALISVKIIPTFAYILEFDGVRSAKCKI